MESSYNDVASKESAAQELLSQSQRLAMETQTKLRQQFVDTKFKLTEAENKCMQLTQQAALLEEKVSELSAKVGSVAALMRRLAHEFPVVACRSKGMKQSSWQLALSSLKLALSTLSWNTALISALRSLRSCCCPCKHSFLSTRRRGLKLNSSSLARCAHQRATACCCAAVGVGAHGARYCSQVAAAEARVAQSEAEAQAQREEYMVSAAAQQLLLDTQEMALDQAHSKATELEQAVSAAFLSCRLYGCYSAATVEIIIAFQ